MRSARLALLIAACACTADDSGAPAVQRTVQSVLSTDSVAIRYEVAGFGEPVLVFVHGWSCDRSYWRAQLDHFAASRRVVADLELTVMPGVGHFLMIEEPEEFNRLLERGIRELAPMSVSTSPPATR